MSTALVIFAKAPIPGFAKTRMIPALGAEGAAALAERMLEHTVAAGMAAGFGYIELCVTPDPGHPAFRLLADRHRLVLSAQGEGDLGARMRRAFARLLQDCSGVVLIGTDAPALDAPRLARAASALSEHDAVFVPAWDGGYALVGLRRPSPELFTDIAWGTSEVMSATRESARRLGLRWTESEPVPDIDEPEDLVHLPAEWHA